MWRNSESECANNDESLSGFGFLRTHISLLIFQHTNHLISHIIQLSVVWNYNLCVFPTIMCWSNTFRFYKLNVEKLGLKNSQGQVHILNGIMNETFMYSDMYDVYVVSTHQILRSTYRRTHMSRWKWCVRVVFIWEHFRDQQF